MSQDLKNDTRCVLPWNHIATNSSGNIRLCCNARHDTIPRKANGDPYKMHRDDISEAWNSEFMKDVRQTMLRGERPTACERCFREEDSGMKSARQNFNHKYNSTLEHLTAHTNDMGEVDVDNVTYFDLRLGNTCNLRCVMCNPWASNQWVKDWQKLNGDLSRQESTRLSKMEWGDDPKVVENLEPFFDSMDLLYFTGGEPTLVKSHMLLLEKLVERGSAKSITLKYNTNLTGAPQRMLELWPEFKSVIVNGSIDAIGTLNDYIRFPSKWDVVDRTLTRYSDIENVKLSAHICVQVYNIFSLHSLLGYLEQFNIEPYFNILDHPDYLNIRVLPDADKQLISELYRNSQYERLVSALDYMWHEDWSNLIPTLREKTHMLDSLRQNKIPVHRLQELLYD